MIAVIFGMAMSVSAQEVSESKYGNDSVTCVTNLSIYNETYKQWENAKFAPEAINMKMVNAWREVLINCPRSSQLIYTRGEKIMDYFIRTNPAQKDAYLDTICMMMDNRANYFPVDPKTSESQVAGIMARKGFLIYTYNKGRYEEAYNLLKDAVALDPSQLQSAYIDAYCKTTVDMVSNGKEAEMTIVDVYQTLSKILDGNIKMLTEKRMQLVENRENARKTGDEEIIATSDKQIERIENAININKDTKNNAINVFKPFVSYEDLVKAEKSSVLYSVDKLLNDGKGSIYIGNVKRPKQVAAYGTPAWVFTTMSISFIDNICLLVFNNCVYSINMYTGGLGNAMTSSTSEATQVNYLVNNGNVYVWNPTDGNPKNDSDYLFVFKILDEQLMLIKAKEKSYKLGKYVYMSDYNKMKKMSEEELVQIEKEALGKLLGN